MKPFPTAKMAGLYQQIVGFLSRGGVQGEGATGGTLRIPRGDWGTLGKH